MQDEKDGKVMKDGRIAWKTDSGRYYARREPSYENYSHIFYYTLRGKRIQLAIGMCQNCEEVIESNMCGDFKYCKCKQSFVDTDRWFPERHRYGGNIKPLDMKNNHETKKEKI